jgi:surface carbohydrate biosynthesis protein
MLNIEKLRFGSPRKCDLLVFDEVSASALGTMLFESMEYSILYKRNKRIHFGIQILRRFIFNLLKTQLWTKWPMNIRLQNFKSIIYISYLLAWIQCVNPRVVITFIDNDWHFQLLSRLYEEANFIAIQNGVRSMFNLSIDLPLYPHPGSKISMPLLYCFGQCEKETYPMFGHKVDQISPVGSLTASWYREKVAPKITCPIIYDILLISQWERMIMIDGRFPEIAYSLKRLDLFINKFISTNKINFAIALRSSDPKEIEYFKNQYGDHITIIEKNMKK